MTRRFVLPLFQETRALPAGAPLPRPLVELTQRALAEKAFRGEAGESLLLLTAGKAAGPPAILLGLGSSKKLTLDGLRRALGALARRLRKEGIEAATLAMDLPWLRDACGRLGWEAVGKAVGSTWRLGGYAFDAYKTNVKDKRRPVRLEIRSSGLPGAAQRELAKGIEVGQVLGEAANRVRDLANTPANDLYPEKLAEHARAIAREAGLKFRLLRRSDLVRERMGALLGVAQGSDRPACLIVMEHEPQRGQRRKAPTLVLVGKAITFDCGGLSIKPAKGMEEMKFDMAGGGAVIGALWALAKLKAPVRAIGIVPAAENVIGGSAMRPGDILRTSSGKTIEVVNTDAEGRLILADALHYARRFNPDYVLDFATLTGACLVALGTQVSGLVTNDDKFAAKVFEAGERSGERVWKLPLYEEFLEATKSQVADLKNSAGRNGGAITAAAFLSHFVGGTPWCHLDIAGTAWAERELGPFAAGATGVGVRLVEEIVRGITGY